MKNRTQFEKELYIFKFLPKSQVCDILQLSNKKWWMFLKLFLIIYWWIIFRNFEHGTILEVQFANSSFNTKFSIQFGVLARKESWVENLVLKELFVNCKLLQEIIKNSFENIYHFLLLNCNISQTCPRKFKNLKLIFKFSVFLMEFCMYLSNAWIWEGS